MINKYKSLLSIILISFLGVSQAQNLESDAINFGTNTNTGTARSVGIGGAISAVGADISIMNYNPAGIGVYKSSVFSITPSFEWTKSDASFLNSSFQNQNSKFNISNFGAVFALKNKKFGVVNDFNLGFSFNSLQSFQQKNEFKRFTTNTITQNWVDEANTVNGSSDGTFTYEKFSFETVGAYYSYLVNFDSSILAYTSPITAAIEQNSITERKGGKRDINISSGVNFGNKLYIGAGISFPFINYKSKTEFKETDTKGINGNFNNFTLINNYKNTGIGFNISAGLIYKPLNFLRFSAAIKSSTRYSMAEEYTSDFETNFSTASYVDTSSQGRFQYSLRTPWRANAGLALIHKKLGFLSFDYELVDYTSTKFFIEDYKILQDELNSKIKNKYQIAHIIKIGAEAKIKKFRIRAGYSIHTSPLKESFREVKYDFSRQEFSGGIGYLWKRFSLDASYRYSLSNEYEVAYDGINGIRKNIDRQLIIVSLGFKLSK